MKTKGFTLIELIVVVTIIGILTAFAIPQYLRSVETAKADDAVSLLKMIGSTNRLYGMDNTSSFVTGQMSTTCNASTDCAPSGQLQNVCNLISCKYLAMQDWSMKPYNVYACDGNASAACQGLGGGNKYVAAAKRVTGSSPGTSIAPYSTWGYTMDINGKVDTYNAAPAPTGL